MKGSLECIATEIEISVGFLEIYVPFGISIPEGFDDAASSGIICSGRQGLPADQLSVQLFE